jgi:hypothetical protein
LAQRRTLATVLGCSPAETANERSAAGKVTGRLNTGDEEERLTVRRARHQGGACAPPAIRSASARISPAPATESRDSSTGSNNVAGWRRATTGLPLTILPSFNSCQSGYGCALMSPRPSWREVTAIKTRRISHWAGTLMSGIAVWRVTRDIARLASTR